MDSAQGIDLAQASLADLEVLSARGLVRLRMFHGLGHDTIPPGEERVFDTNVEPPFWFCGECMLILKADAPGCVVVDLFVARSEVKLAAGRPVEDFGALHEGDSPPTYVAGRGSPIQLRIRNTSAKPVHVATGCILHELVR